MVQIGLRKLLSLVQCVWKLGGHLSTRSNGWFLLCGVRSLSVVCKVAVQWDSQGDRTSSATPGCFFLHEPCLRELGTLTKMQLLLGICLKSSKLFLYGSEWVYLNLFWEQVLSGRERKIARGRLLKLLGEKAKIKWGCHCHKEGVGDATITREDESVLPDELILLHCLTRLLCSFKILSEISQWQVKSSTQMRLTEHLG